MAVYGYMTKGDGLRNLRCDESETAATFISGKTLLFQKSGRAKRGNRAASDFRKNSSGDSEYSMHGFGIMAFFGRISTQCREG